VALHLGVAERKFSQCVLIDVFKRKEIEITRKILERGDGTGGAGTREALTVLLGKLRANTARQVRRCRLKPVFASME
jgi:hypothetical protein